MPRSDPETARLDLVALEAQTSPVHLSTEETSRAPSPTLLPFSNPSDFTAPVLARPPSFSPTLGGVVQVVFGCPPVLGRPRDSPLDRVRLLELFLRCVPHASTSAASAPLCAACGSIPGAHRPGCELLRLRHVYVDGVASRPADADPLRGALRAELASSRAAVAREFGFEPDQVCVAAALRLLGAGAPHPDAGALVADLADLDLALGDAAELSTGLARCVAAGGRVSEEESGCGVSRLCRAHGDGDGDGDGARLRPLLLLAAGGGLAACLALLLLLVVMGTAAPC